VALENPYEYRLSKEAEIDVFEGYLWYENQRIGLGEEFLAALDAAEQIISKYPRSFQVRYKKKVRAFVLDRFPYLVFYVFNNPTIDVISVFNINQNPRKWKKRIK
jgi:hypothetical protein